MKVERVLLDTNVLISAALQPLGPPMTTLRFVQDCGGRLVFSDETFFELTSRLRRPKFDRYLGNDGLGPDRRDAYLAGLLALSDFTTITGTRMGCRDPDDDKVLETALMGEAEVIVTGDADLLVLGMFQRIEIVTPQGFLLGVQLPKTPLPRT